MNQRVRPEVAGPMTGLLESDRASYREQARWSLSGVPWQRQTVFSWQLSDAERRGRFEKAWARGDLVYTLTQLWADQGVDVDGNKLVADLIRESPGRSSTPLNGGPGFRTLIRLEPSGRASIQTTTPPAPPQCHAGASRRGANSGDYGLWFTTNSCRRRGWRRVPRLAAFRAIMAVHPITGRGGKPLSDAWANGPKTYLGLAVAGFPILLLATGPGSPSVLSNMAVSIEQHVDWIVERLTGMREAGFTTIEATEMAQAGWTRHLADCSMLTLHRLANTWYTGANVPAKAREVQPDTGELVLTDASAASRPPRHARC